MQLTARKLYRDFISERWAMYGLGTVTLIMTSVAEVMTPKLSQWCLDIIVYGRKAEQIPTQLRGLAPTDALEHAMFALVGLMVFALIGRWGWRQTLARLTHVAGYHIKIGFWDRLRHVPLKDLQKHTLGDIMSRATADWTMSRSIYGFTLVVSYDLFFCTSMAIVCMWMINWQLTLMSLILWPALPPLIIRLARREHDQHLKAQEALGRLSESISQSLSCQRLQRTTASESRWRRELDGFAESYADKRLHVLRTGWQIFPLGALPALFAYAILFLFGVHKIKSHEITIGEFVAMQSYVLFLQAPLLELGNHIAEWQRGIGSLRRIAELFRLRTEEPSRGERRTNQHMPPVQLDVLRVTELSFSYEGQSKPLFTGVTFSVAPGQLVGIHGPVGAGKSTLLKLIAGLDKPPLGAIDLQGDDGYNLSRPDAQKRVTMVPQRSFLFAGPIRQNLCLDNRFSDDELWRALAIVELDREVKSFPDGLETKIGEWGMTLSGGQKQRLTLARAILRPRPLLLLDDCLSAVDVKTELSILHNLRTQFQNPSTHNQAIVWIAHRVTTLQLCDVIYTLEGGVLRQDQALRAAGDGRTPCD